jgi:hypothetical protein
VLFACGGLFVHLGKNWERFRPLHRLFLPSSRAKQFTEFSAALRSSEENVLRIALGDPIHAVDQATAFGFVAGSHRVHRSAWGKQWTHVIIHNARRAGSSAAKARVSCSVSGPK